jgi:hypothetical protein
MIILTDGKDDYNWYLDLRTLKACARNRFRVILYRNGTEYIRRVNDMIVVKEVV